MDSTLKKPAGSNDAVTEPVMILDESKASSVSAVLGISNKSLPEPLNTEPDESFTSPIKVEPLSSDVTKNPSTGETDAVTAPLTIKFVSNASSVNAERGMLNKFSPLPLNAEPLLSCTFPLTNKEPLNSVVTEPVDSTLKKPSVERDAVTEPVAIRFEINASSVSAVLGMLNKFSPLPENEEPLFSSIPPLTNTEPLNTEPLTTEVTTNPSCGSTEAVTAPLTINGDCKASGASAERGMLNKFSPLPLNAEPLLS